MVLTTRTSIHLSATAHTTLLGPDGTPVSSAITKLDLKVASTTIVVAQTEADAVIRELGGQHTGLPTMFGDSGGIVMPTVAEMVRLGLGGQRLLRAESPRA